MVKPFSEEGASIKYFSAYKPTKKDKGNWSRQNRVAYDKAMSEIMLRAAQYQRKHGTLPPNYARMTNIPPPPKPKFVPSEPIKKTGTGSRGGGLDIDESKAEKTPHEKTEALRERKTEINNIIDQLAWAAKTGDIKSGIEGINKKEKKGWFERNIGQKIGSVYHHTAESAIGDVTGAAMDLISRPGQAAVGALTGITHHPWAGVSEAETVQEAEKRLGPLSPEQKANIQDVRSKWEKTHKQSIWHRTLMGLEGKEQYTFVDPQMADALKKNKYKNLKGGQKSFALGTGIAMDAFYDPTNVIGGGVVAKGIELSKDVSKGARTAENVVSGVKAAGHAADASRDARVTQKVLKAPLELEAVSQSTRRAKQGAFEFGGTVQAQKRAEELTEQARKATRIKGASDAGYKELVQQAKAQARKVVTAKRLAASGKLDPAEAAIEVTKHEGLLKRVKDAESLRETARILPVGGKLSILEKRSARLATLASKHPENAQLIKKSNEAQKAVETARLAAIPENAELVVQAAEKLATGKKVTSAEVKAIVEAPANLQDQLIAAAKAAEEMPGKARLVDEVAGGTKKGRHAATSITGDAADLPSNRIIAAINKAAEEATATAASKSTLSDAAKIASDENMSKRARQIAFDSLNEAKVHNRKLTPATIKSRAAQEALKLMDEDIVREAAVRSTGRKIAEVKSTGEKLIPSTRKMAMLEESLLEEVLPVLDQVEKLLLEGSEKRFAMRFAGRDLGEFKPIGQMLSKAYVPFELTGKLGAKIPGSETFVKGFKMGAHFPGETNYIRQMAENSGTVAHKGFVNDVHKAFKNMSRAEAKQITQAIEGGYVIPDERLEGLRKIAIQMRNDIFDKQTLTGKYVPAQKAKNYVYHYYHSRNKKAITAMKKGRTDDIKNGLPGPRLEEASKKGLKPETEIDKILIMQHRDYVRDLQRANFRQQIMDNFGSLIDHPGTAQGLGLQEVSKDSLPKMFQDTAAAKKAKYYLPPEVHETFKAMDDLMSIGFNKETEQFLNGFDGLVRIYKTTATIGNPGNWINNTVGDFFLNWMDGVRSPLWYKKSASVMRSRRLDDVMGPLERPKTLGVAGHSVDTNSLLRDFHAKAPTGGFIGSEGTGTLSRLGTHGVRGVPAKAGQFVQRQYEGREEWVRFAHFLHATDDEARRLIRAGRGKTFEDVRESATELAAKRVSKWNIDYTELTPFERQLRKRYIPFYTFVRKATPLMLEGMITRPGKINQYNRAQRSIEQFLGVPKMEDDGTNWPEWTKEQGITRLTSENEPLYLRDPSPLNVINRVFGSGGSDSPRALLNNAANMTSPLLKAPIEANSGRSLYNDAPITDWKSWGLNQLPTASIVARALGHPLSPQKPVGEEGKARAKEGTAILERLGVVGVPVGRNTEARQQAALHQEVNKSDDIFKQVNEAIAPWEVKAGHSSKVGDYYYVKNPQGEIVSRHRDFVQAVKATQDRLAAGV